MCVNRQLLLPLYLAGDVLLSLSARQGQQQGGRQLSGQKYNSLSVWADSRGIAARGCTARAVRYPTTARPALSCFFTQLFLCDIDEGLDL